MKKTIYFYFLLIYLDANFDGEDPGIAEAIIRSVKRRDSMPTTHQKGSDRELKGKHKHKGDQKPTIPKHTPDGEFGEDVPGRQKHPHEVMEEMTTTRKPKHQHAGDEAKNHKKIKHAHEGYEETTTTTKAPKKKNHKHKVLQKHRGG